MDAKFAVGAVLLIGVILIAGCTQQPQAEQTLKIGVVASMTGSASTTGKDIWQSAVLAVEEINADGGVYIKDLGRKVPIEAILGDDESTREGGQKAVTRLVTEDKVDLLVGVTAAEGPARGVRDAAAPRHAQSECFSLFRHASPPS